MDLRARGVGCISPGELLFHVFAALAQFECSLIRERTRAGIDATKARGQHCGRRPSLIPAQARHAKTLIDGGESEREVGRLLGVSHISVRRALARLKSLSQPPTRPWGSARLGIELLRDTPLSPFSLLT